MAKDVSERAFTTVSGVPIERLYTPDHIQDLDYEADLGDPGKPPYTRGIYPAMYRGRLWTMRQFSGFGSAADTNARFQYLLKHGQTGLSVAFHLPTLMGYDSDHPMSEGEVGRCGVAIDSLADMEVLFKGIPLDKISTSMTTNAPSLTSTWPFSIKAMETRSFMVMGLRGGSMVIPAVRDLICSFPNSCLETRSAKLCSGQVFSDTKIGCSSAIFRSKTLGDR